MKLITYRVIVKVAGEEFTVATFSHFETADFCAKSLRGVGTRARVQS